jgi:hypothetical protein
MAATAIVLAEQLREAVAAGRDVRGHDEAALAADLARLDPKSRIAFQRSRTAHDVFDGSQSRSADPKFVHELGDRRLVALDLDVNAEGAISHEAA